MLKETVVDRVDVLVGLGWRDQFIGCLERDLNLGSYERKEFTNANLLMAELYTTF